MPYHSAGLNGGAFNRRGIDMGEVIIRLTVEQAELLFTILLQLNSESNIEGAKWATVVELVETVEEAIVFHAVE
jgi:hypothetical protein